MRGVTARTTFASKPTRPCTRTGARPLPVRGHSEIHLFLSPRRMRSQACSTSSGSLSPRQHVRRPERQDAQGGVLMQAVYDLVYRAVASGGDDQAIPCQSGELGGVGIRALGVQHFYLEATGAQGLRAALEAGLVACAPRVRVSDYDSVASHPPYYKPFASGASAAYHIPVDGLWYPG